MASSQYFAEDVLDAVFDDDFGLSDGDSSEDDEDERIHGYLGSSFFTAPEPDNGDLQQDEELAANEVESVEIGEDQVKITLNEENIIDEQLPVIHEGEVSADAPSSPRKESSDATEDATELSNHVEATSDEVEAPLMDEGEVSPVAAYSSTDEDEPAIEPSCSGVSPVADSNTTDDEPSCSGDAAVANDTVSHTPIATYIKLM